MRLLGTKPILTLVVAGLIVGATAGIIFAAEVLPMGNEYGLPQMGDVDPEEIKRQYEEQKQWGFVSRFGRTDWVQSVDTEEKTIEVNTPIGLKTFSVSDETEVHKELYGADEKLTLDDLEVGALVTVDGEKGSKEGAAADILVIVDGKDGFNIQPAEGDGPHLLPVFP